MVLRQFSIQRKFSGTRRLAVLLVIVVLYFIAQSSGRLSNPFTHITDAVPSPAGVPNSLPEADEFPLENKQDSSFCSDRFSLRYLDYLRNHSIQYCTPGSEDNLTCFHSHTQQNNDRDSLCVGFGATLQPSGTFDLGCQIRPPNKTETDRGLIPFQRIKSYWYNTGPGYVFANFVRFSDRFLSEASTLADSIATDTANEKRFVVLIKREGHSHIWHGLMEIWSMTLTFDTLRLASDAGGSPIFKYPEDMENTQVIILDDYENGPIYELWTLFTHHKPVRMKEIMADSAQAHFFQTHPHNIIVPLPGASNTLWQNDWEERDCHQATLLKIFVRRVMKHYGLEYQTATGNMVKTKQKDIILTFVNRTGTRKLLNQTSLLNAIEKKYAYVTVQSIDFATISFPEQLRLIQETDILVGVHGAGLTHTMFMREGAGAVVEILPDGMLYKGFRNLAVMTGHQYLTATADLEQKNEERHDLGNSPQSRGIRNIDWHFADVSMDEETFVKLIDDAVESL